ncbi:MAG TPA: hypothetical protein VGF55_17970 [Gemmataceae bacterium]|jgi:hypothetical protein
MYLSTLAIVLVVAAEPLPQSTLRLPQTTLDCPCPAGGPCACGPGGCPCGSACRCPACPGTKPSNGIAPTADDAIRSAAAAGCPLIAFVNQPARSVPGAVSYRADPRAVAGPWTWAGSATGGTYLPAGATDAELLSAAAAHLPRRMPVGPPAVFGCPGGVCR